MLTVTSSFSYWYSPKFQSSMVPFIEAIFGKGSGNRVRFLSIDGTDTDKIADCKDVDNPNFSEYDFIIRLFPRFFSERPMGASRLYDKMYEENDPDTLRMLVIAHELAHIKSLKRRESRGHSKYQDKKRGIMR